VTVVPLPRVPIATVQGTLALDLQPHLEPPPPRGAPLGRDEAEVDLWARRFAQAAVEIVGGDRPVSQLLRWTTGAAGGPGQRPPARSRPGPAGAAAGAQRAHHVRHPDGRRDEHPRALRRAVPGSRGAVRAASRSVALHGAGLRLS